jgi:hypothetical protein
MTYYLISRGAKETDISTIPVWPVMNEKCNEDRMSNPFRIDNNFGDKIVIMYSGNHAYVHPLDTLLMTALKMKNNLNILFVFVGGGVRKKDVTDFKIKFGLNNIIQLPFQPRENIHNSLGSSDIQVVILGEGQVGYTHPNKIYGALYVGKSILYIGPQKSDVEKLVDELTVFANKNFKEIDLIGLNNQKFASFNFDPEFLKTKMAEAVVN